MALFFLRLHILIFLFSLIVLCLWLHLSPKWVTKSQFLLIFLFSFSLKIFFNVGHFKNHYWICYNTASVVYVLFFGFQACGFLAPWPGTKPTPAVLEVLTTEQPESPGKALTYCIFYDPSLEISHQKFFSPKIQNITIVNNCIWSPSASYVEYLTQKPIFEIHVEVYVCIFHVECIISSLIYKLGQTTKVLLKVVWDHWDTKLYEQNNPDFRRLFIYILY